MSLYTPRLARLMQALRRLPGIGPKSAQRIAFHLLERDREGAESLHLALSAALAGISRCPTCRMFREEDSCTYCSGARVATGTLCVVENPADLAAIEQHTAYRGRYFVLMGHLSPLDGIGPEELGLPALEAILAEGGVREIILATNSTVEGEATAYYIAERARPLGIAVSRIAHGVPMGGELEYVDASTLSRALSARQTV